MKSEFFVGILGLLFVTSTVVGGMVLAGICQRNFTPTTEVFYMVWLWIGLIPFWWIIGRTMPERIPRPAATWLLLLPLLLLYGFLLDAFGANNRWIILVWAAASYVSFSIAEHFFGTNGNGRAPESLDVDRLEGILRQCIKPRAVGLIISVAPEVIARSAAVLFPGHVHVRT